MSDATPPAASGPAEDPGTSAATAYLPIGLVFFVIGVSQLRQGWGIAFLVLGIVFLGMSIGGNLAGTRRAAGPSDDAAPGGPEGPPA
ncbi:hypothetical protein ICW40_13870 [Actinotalea ferrariae]|uniref:hypothetical protein n=1 Tax=Actinotalea ferrariae TaxID=1386098 RepID=UPI001C8B8860|nr:hypothetical protein [Actinotalea ferrariae]MBX9245891.1 hypothetical protein [Actinotalea ferrariae]